MELVSIREASQRLRISPARVRECIRGGELNAVREVQADGRVSWRVEMPQDDWVSEATALELSREFSPWWWGTANKTGYIHYVESLSASSWEETVPKFLCGEIGDNIWGGHRIAPGVAVPGVPDAGNGAGFAQGQPIIAAPQGHRVSTFCGFFQLGLPLPARKSERTPACSI